MLINFVTVEEVKTGKLDCITLYTSEPLTEMKAKEIIKLTLGNDYFFNQINDNPFED